MTDSAHDPVFDRAARDFDRLAPYLWAPIGRSTVACAAPAPGDRVLDACCGAGASALPAAGLVGEEGRVDAVDLSEGLIEILTRSGWNLPALRPHRADVTAWPTGGYDIVQCALGIFFFPDMVTGTRHLISRLRPGGRAAFTIWRRGAVEAAGRHLQGALEQVTGRAPRQRTEGLLDRINEAEAYGDWLTEQGLADVSVTESPLTVPMTPEVAWLIITGSGFVAALEGLDGARVAQVRDAYLRSLAKSGERELDATTLIGVGSRR